MLFRLLGLAVLAMVGGLLVATFGPWAHAGAESLSRSEAGGYSFSAAVIWIAIFTQWARDPRRARHWHPWAAFGIGAVTAALATADLVMVAGSQVDDYGALTVGWGLATTFVIAHLVVLTTLAFAWTSRGRISRNPPPWPNWWEFEPADPLRSALGVVWLGAVLLAVGSVGPWAGSEGNGVSGLDLDGPITLALAVVTGGLAVSLYGPPAMTTSLRAFVLPFGGAALTVALLALTDLQGASGIESRWGIWMTVLGGAVTVVGAAMLALVPLPNVTTRGSAPPRWARRARNERTGPPLPAPPTA